MKSTAIQLSILLFACVAIASGSAYSQSAPISEKLADVIESAKREGNLNIVWSASSYGDEAAVRQHITAMNKMFGTNVGFRFSSGTSMPQQANKLLTEHKAGQPASSDLLVTGGPTIKELLPQGLFLTAPWMKLANGRVQPDMVEVSGQALRLATGISAVTYNSKLFPNPPTSLHDLLAPEWKGKIATTPYASGFDVLMANDFWGVDKTFDFVQKFMPQTAGLIRCGEVERIASGEFPIFALECLSQTTELWKAKGAPVDFFIPSDAAQLRYQYFTIPKNAASPNVAVLFGLYLTSVEGQAALWQTVKLDLDNFPESNSAKLLKRYTDKGVEFRRIGADWWISHPEVGDNMNALLRFFTTSK